jgi:formylglycine-generating enzyme required for sulfatase activity
MKLSGILHGLAFLLVAPLCLAQAPPDGFVLIKGGTFQSGDVATDKNRGRVRVDDFEILDHEVTNLEYKRFIDATGYRAPLHWTGGKIPPGKENYPVIFVNLADADRYLRWLTAKDKRLYRLPTGVEFEYAARGGAPWISSTRGGMMRRKDRPILMPKTTERSTDGKTI